MRYDRTSKDSATIGGIDLQQDSTQAQVLRHIEVTAHTLPSKVPVFLVANEIRAHNPGPESQCLVNVTAYTRVLSRTNESTHLSICTFSNHIPPIVRKCQCLSLQALTPAAPTFSKERLLGAMDNKYA